jgi:hypothetical protein
MENEKFCEELIGYFTLKPHGPHRKRKKEIRTQQRDLIKFRSNVAFLMSD